MTIITGRPLAAPHTSSPSPHQRHAQLHRPSQCPALARLGLPATGNHPTTADLHEVPAGLAELAHHATLRPMKLLCWVVAAHRACTTGRTAPTNICCCQPGTACALSLTGPVAVPTATCRPGRHPTPWAEPERRSWWRGRGPWRHFRQQLMLSAVPAFSDAPPAPQALAAAARRA